MNPNLALRFPLEKVIYSNLDHKTDIRNFISYLCARDYLQDILIQHHGLTKADAVARTPKIIPHIRIALEYVDLAWQSPEEIAPVACYYAILNLFKSIILMGPLHAELANNMWHGASYKHDNSRKTLLTDELTLHCKGALPLYYKHITGSSIAKKKIIKLSQVYPHVRIIAAELALATGADGSFLNFELEFLPGNKQTIPCVRFDRREMGTISRKLAAFPHYKHFTKEKNSVRFTGPPIVIGNVQDEFRKGIKPFLFFHPNKPKHGRTLTGIIAHPNRIGMEVPEELYIAFLFFHMSNVSRYNPEGILKLKESKFWPVIVAARRHALFHALVIYWSIAHQRTLMIMNP